MSLPVWLPDAMFLLEVGGICPGVSVQGVLYKETPLESEKRVLRILLECFLVSY